MRFVLGLAMAACAASSFAGVWVETGDAGDLLASAQVTRGIGDLLEIRGRLTSGADIDMFCVDIVSPGNFFASTTGVVFNTQLWLFDREGMGVTFHDDVSNSDFTSILSPQFVSFRQPGHYFLAISSFDADARDSQNFELWQDDPRQNERMPDGLSQPAALHHWDSNGETFGDYRILLSGSAFCAVPEPTTFSAFVIGSLSLLARRRTRR